ncbi:MAG: ribbon-helix-helix domain-containing protein [Myxococcales bacterium]
MKDVDEVATHVLVPVSIAERLRELARKTRVTQSEYLREAVADLLVKYQAVVAGSEQNKGNGTHG